MALDVLFCKDLMVNVENCPVRFFTFFFPKHVNFTPRYWHLVLGNSLSVFFFFFFFCLFLLNFFQSVHG